MVIEAVRFDGTDRTFTEIQKLPWFSLDGVCPASMTGTELSIKTLEGEMVAVPGDWIICGVKGELYPCKPDIFDATYERA